MLSTSANAAQDGNSLEAITLTSSDIAYPHAWSNCWRLTVTAATFETDNNIALTAGNATQNIVSGSVNLLYSPTPKLTFGTE